MTKAELVNELVETCIEQAPSGIWYLTPMWRDAPVLQEYTGDLRELLEILRLTVDQRNAMDNKINYIIQWIADIVQPGVEAMSDKEVELVNNMFAYMFADKQRKANIDGWNFSKRTD